MQPGSTRNQQNPSKIPHENRCWIGRLFRNLRADVFPEPYATDPSTSLPLASGPEPRVEVRERAVPISVLCGLLWNCRDTLPSLVCTMLADAGIERCGSYASAARQMRAAIAKQVDADTARAA